MIYSGGSTSDRNGSMIRVQKGTSTMLSNTSSNKVGIFRGFIPNIDRSMSPIRRNVSLNINKSSDPYLFSSLSSNNVLLKCPYKVLPMRFPVLALSNLISQASGTTSSFSSPTPLSSLGHQPFLKTDLIFLKTLYNIVKKK